MSALNPVVGKEQVVSNVTHNLSKSLKNRQRVSEYFRANVGTEELLLRLAGVGGITFVTCAGAGAMIGGLAGGAKGALIGFGAGAGAGLIITCIYGGVKIRGHFNDWKASMVDTCVTAEFNQILTTDERFRDFWCPLTLELFEDPTITNCRHTFEKNPLIEHLENNSATCPLCMAPVDLKDLSTDIVMIARIKKAFSNITKEFLKDPNQQYSPEVIQAFEALCKDMEVQVKEVVSEVTSKLTLAQLDGKITPQECVRQITQLNILFDDEPEKKA